MGRKTVLIAWALISQAGLLNTAFAACQTPGATVAKVNGNDVCVVSPTRIPCLGDGAPGGNITPLDSAGLPAMFAVPACSSPGTCGSKVLNGRSIQLETSRKTGNCSFPGLTQSECLSPNTWQRGSCDAGPRQVPSCPAGSKLDTGGIGVYACYSPIIRCPVGTMYNTQTAPGSQYTIFCVVN